MRQAAACGAVRLGESSRLGSVTWRASLRIGPFNVVALVNEVATVPSMWFLIPWTISVMVPVHWIEEVRQQWLRRGSHACMVRGDAHNSF